MRCVHTGGILELKILETGINKTSLYCFSWTKKCLFDKIQRAYFLQHFTSIK